MSETRFTERAQAALRLAQECSAELGHGYVGSEHLLLGLAREGKGVAAKVLQSAGLEPESLKAAIARMVGVGAPGGAPSQGLTPRCKKIIELSLTEAARLGHHYVGTEHLLLGILREGDGVAVRVLSGTGVEPRRLHADVVAAMGGEASPSPFRGGGKTRAELVSLMDKDIWITPTQAREYGLIDEIVGAAQEPEEEPAAFVAAAGRRIRLTAAMREQYQAHVAAERAEAARKDEAARTLARLRALAGF